MKNAPPRPMGRRTLHAGAAAGILTLLAGGAWYGYHAITTQPVERVAFAGSTARISAADLEALSRSIQAAPGRLALAEVRDAARRIPWVREASVRRTSPRSVEIHFETHEPLARWNDTALVSVRGAVFSAEHDAPLPLFRGEPAGAAAMARALPGLEQALQPLGSRIAELRLSRRGAWQATLASGLVIELGRGDTGARIKRFVEAWPELMARGVRVRHADLRYANGFALRKAT